VNIVLEATDYCDVDFGTAAIRALLTTHNGVFYDSYIDSGSAYASPRDNEITAFAPEDIVGTIVEVDSSQVLVSAVTILDAYATYYETEQRTTITNDPFVTPLLDAEGRRSLKNQATSGAFGTFTTSENVGGAYAAFTYSEVALAPQSSVFGTLTAEVEITYNLGNGAGRRRSMVHVDEALDNAPSALRRLAQADETLISEANADVGISSDNVPVAEGTNTRVVSKATPMHVTVLVVIGLFAAAACCGFVACYSMWSSYWVGVDKTVQKEQPAVEMAKAKQIETVTQDDVAMFYSPAVQNRVGDV